MTDTNENQALGSISKGERDSTLENTLPQAAKVDTPLILPKGALIAFRQSGGLKFRSREIVIYADGRVSYGGADLAKRTHERTQRKINDAQIMQLRKMLQKTNFFGLRMTPSHQPPDSFAYEIMAQLGSRSNYVEVFTGTIPDALVPLVEQLVRLMPKVQTENNP